MSDLLTRSQVEERLQCGTSHLYALMRRGDFPRPLKISSRCVRWRVVDVDAYLDRLTAERDAAA